MNLDQIKQALLESYRQDGGINHLDGANLPSEAVVNSLAVDFMHLLFPGFFEEKAPHRDEVDAVVTRLLARIEQKLRSEITKALAFGNRPNPELAAATETMAVLAEFPRLRKLIQTDVEAAYLGDPAAKNTGEIILAYPCVLVISLQRIANVMFRRGIPLLPRLITEFAHERTGADIHPGATIGTHFFIDHCTGVVIGETATIGDHVKIYQGVTLGAKSFAKDSAGNPVKGVKRHPDIEDGVTIYAGATILGGDTRVGAQSIVASNVSLMESVPPHSIVSSEGERLVVRRRRKHESLEGYVDLGGGI